MHDRPEKRPGLEQLIDAMAMYLADIRIRATSVEVEMDVAGLRVRLARAIPEGDHDIAGAAVGVLLEAAAMLNARPELAGRPIVIGVVP